MKLARSLPGGEVRIEEVPDLQPGPGEIVVRVLACGVCGSDVSDEWVAAKLPAVLGHEICGEVFAHGAGAIGPAVGARVVVHHHAPCGECRRCRRGHETLCEAFRASAVDPGGFAEQLLVPAALTGELLDVGQLDVEQAIFVEPLACVLRALDRSGLRAGDSLLVVGAGSNGLLMIAAAHARAVEAVWVREPRPERLDRALALGGERHGNEQVDTAIVCAPGPDGIAAARAAVAPGGTLCLYAPPKPGTALGLDALALYRDEIAICASYSAGPADMRAALALIAAGTVDPAVLVTHRYALAETAAALDAARTSAALKAIVIT